MFSFWNIWPLTIMRRRKSLEFYERSGELPWQRPRVLHEQRDKLLYDALKERLTFVVDHSNKYAVREYYRDTETGQIWEMRDADIGHTTYVVLAPVNTIPTEPLPQDI